MVSERGLDRLLVDARQAQGRTGAGQRPGPGLLCRVLGEGERPDSGDPGAEERGRCARAREPPGVQPGREEHRGDGGPGGGVRGSDLAAAIPALGAAVRGHLRGGHRHEGHGEEQGREEVLSHHAQSVRVRDAGVDGVRDGRPERAVERAGEEGPSHACVPVILPRRRRELAHDRALGVAQEVLLTNCWSVLRLIAEQIRLHARRRVSMIRQW